MLSASKHQASSFSSFISYYRSHPTHALLVIPLGSLYYQHLSIRHQASPPLFHLIVANHAAIAASWSSSDLPCQATVTDDLSEDLIPERQTHDLNFGVIHELENEPTIRLFANGLAIVVSQLP